MRSLTGDVRIRDFGREDYEAVANILANSFEDKFRSLIRLPREKLIGLLKDSGLAGNEPFKGYFVAELDGSVVGVLLLRWRGQMRAFGHRKIGFWR